LANQKQLKGQLGHDYIRRRSNRPLEWLMEGSPGNRLLVMTRNQWIVR
jgi:hypothetical protein